MIVIRREQIEALEKTSRESFARDLLAYLASLYPQQVAAVGDGPACESFVRRAIDKGLDHGFGDRGGVTVLAELMLQFGEDFERSPLRAWTRNVLSEQGLPGLLKSESLRERYRELTGGRPVLTF